MALYRCLDSDGERLEKLASENNIKLERMDDDNYTDRCPSCGDSEFWSGGVCHHCGFSNLD